MAAGGVCSSFTGCLKRLEYARELTYSIALWLQNIRKYLAHPQQEQMPRLGGVNQRNQMWQDYTCGNRCCHYNPRNKLLLWSLGEIVLPKLRSDALTRRSGFKENTVFPTPLGHLQKCIALESKISNQVSSAEKYLIFFAIFANTFNIIIYFYSGCIKSWNVQNN